MTPVYVQSPDGPALLNVLVAGYRVDQGVAQTLKNSTGGSEYVFVSHGHVVTSTLVRGHCRNRAAAAEQFQRTQISDYLALPQPLLDISGAPVGQLFILRSLAGARQRLTALRTPDHRSLAAGAGRRAGRDLPGGAQDHAAGG